MSLQAVIFAGGGTGGHIFPAIAILESLHARQPDLPPLFLCSSRDIDRRILEPRALAFRPVPARPFSLRPGPLLQFVRTWSGVVRSCTSAIASHLQKHGVAPESAALVATGGFVSAPAVAAARRLGLHTALVNLDAIPGKANRHLASRTDVIFSTYQALGAQLVGPIVRREARAPRDRAACRRRFDLEPARRTLLVTGASQGAESLNRLVPSLVRHNPQAFADWQILHQAGPERSADVQASYASLPVRAEVVELIDDVGSMWGAADLAIARAGAGTVAEAWINRVPTVFLPYPYHPDEHQRHNAMPLQSAGAALICRDLIDPERNIAAHAEMLVRLLTESRGLLAMSSGFERLAPPDGAEAIASHLRNL
ncbi:MAG: UDP-N-acetylglucosamine--N-acetylmuramyl-(pentapeptide) pyrophosphoryl-undecaprenol N-acetylglucosamine transferase [Leptolyngbya sp. PLA3]|nr:MAG: UDP-N-acetylglucosamine--N-acetylmuramyl-(pentapeptide) pyrophosphoryl-undecaprenol N-acetylglucosamine transferase [Cyanobacteria bacterium CYA]MCE7969715.1 UDP-N-acetylglucosamine--N-acetylmuramyl-(pentapeptide) pyrophosphoryl-undecaprenol N-acetylglucosamine transferase [Leptolyngbya sp. PL-A3]